MGGSSKERRDRFPLSFFGVKRGFKLPQILLIFHRMRRIKIGEDDPRDGGRCDGHFPDPASNEDSHKDAGRQGHDRHALSSGFSKISQPSDASK